MMIWRLGTIMLTPRKRAFRFSGSSWRPAYPGFMVMKMPTRGSRLTVLPSVKTNAFLRSLMALRMQCTCRTTRQHQDQQGMQFKGNNKLMQQF